MFLSELIEQYYCHNWWSIHDRTMFSFECGNPVFGKTLNPWGKNRSPGGSSGGEAALLASDGTVLGYGWGYFKFSESRTDLDTFHRSDAGGSLRTPAHYSGCYGLKTTPGRFLPGEDANSPIHNPGFISVVGSFASSPSETVSLTAKCSPQLRVQWDGERRIPFSIITKSHFIFRSVDDLILQTKALTSAEFFNTLPERRVVIPEEFHPKPWTDLTESESRKWRFGFYKSGVSYKGRLVLKICG
jgi:hypothetical protein